MTSPVLSPVQQTAARWPWQRNLQTRIVLTFTLLFLVVLALLMLRVSQSIYQAQLEASTHNLEIAAFLAANALEDPLSGYEAEFERFANWEAEQGDEKREKPSAGTDDHEGQEDQKDKVGTQAPMSGVEPPPSSARLQQIASVYAADTGTRVTILTPLGNALADSALSITQIGNQSAHIEVQAALQGHTQHDVRTDPHDGQPTLYAAAPIQQSGRTVGVVQLAQPLEMILQPIRTSLLGFAIAGLLALVLIALLSMWTARRLVRPIRALEQAALAIATGDLNQQVPTESADELGALAAAFNHMAAQLRQTLEQQRQFVANASHELRTPLTNIKLRSELLLESGLDDPELAGRYLAEIDSEADRLGRLASTLLDLSRLESSQAVQHQPLTPIDVRPVLSAVVATMTLRARSAGLTLQVQLSPSLPPLRVWPEQIEAILLNLLDNAIKYTPAGGQIYLSAAAMPDRCQLRVADTGSGIPQADLPHIFDRFYRVDKARSRRSGQHGVGLGLSIVQALVLQNGGQISVTSAVGQGTTFTLEFPASAPLTADAANARCVSQA
ncbi:MAG: HAMP domain-containing sensor histidine kinase [Anaerolineae bacterium]